MPCQGCGGKGRLRVASWIKCPACTRDTMRPCDGLDPAIRCPYCNFVGRAMCRECRAKGEITFDQPKLTWKCLRCSKTFALDKVEVWSMV